MGTFLEDTSRAEPELRRVFLNPDLKHIVAGYQPEFVALDLDANALLFLKISDKNHYGKYIIMKTIMRAETLRRRYRPVCKMYEGSLIGE